MEHSRQYLSTYFFALQGLHPFFAEQGLHPFFALQGLQPFFALHGLHPFGLQGLQPAATWIGLSGVSAAMADGNSTTPAVRAAILNVDSVFFSIYSISV
jgi:hypothetical protein